MRAFPGRGIRLNPGHPDYRGCVQALPVLMRGGTVIQDVSGWGRKNGAALVLGAGTPYWNKMESGIGLGLTSTVAWYSSVTAQPVDAQLTNDFSMMARLMPIDMGTTIAQVVNGCGLFMNAGGAIGICIYNGATITPFTTSVGLACVQGRENAVGIRWKYGSNLPDFFLNGKKEIGAVPINNNGFSQVNILGSTSVTYGGSMYGRDFRTWNRYLPDAAFMRYATNPHGFYTTPRRFFKGATSRNHGGFLRFINPQHQM